MSHFCLVVATQTQEGVRDALYPFWNDDRDDGPAQPHFIFIEDEFADVNPSTGRRGYWRNPIAKWDGWTTGGAWAGLFEGADQIQAGALPALLERNAKLLALIYALLIDGRWSEADKQYRTSWTRTVETTLLVLAPPTWLTVIDCHC